VADGIRAGVFNDLASGSNVDLCVIRKNNVEYIRPYDTASVKGERQISYRYKPGTTAVLSKTVQPIIVENETVSRIESEPMDTSS
jgi:20S proteasome subunit beta 2